MRYVLLFVALLGIADSGLALREHYRTDSSPCSINAKWDCGIVNKSEYAVFHGVPVAIIGMVGYALLGILGLKRAYRLLLPTAAVGLVFSLYLAHVEASILGVWCIYCVISLAIISFITLLALIAVLVQALRRPSPAVSVGASYR